MPGCVSTARFSVWSYLGAEAASRCANGRAKMSHSPNTRAFLCSHVTRSNTRRPQRRLTANAPRCHLRVVEVVEVADRRELPRPRHR